MEEFNDISFQEEGEQEESDHQSELSDSQFADSQEENDDQDIGEMKAKFDKIMSNFMEDQSNHGEEPAEIFK